MQQLIEILLWVCIFLPIHSYIFYPIIISIISKLFPKNINSEITNFPNVSIIVSAYNEEKVIEQRIKNIAQQKYDFNKIEMLIGSDNSNDNTNEIIKELSSKYSWIKFVEFKTRRGKVAVINNLVNLAKGEILIFTDANTEFYDDAIQKLIVGFKDEKIGGISGKLKLIEPKLDSNMLTREIDYWDFEVMLKELEGKLGILIGANGGIFAIRKKLFETLPLSKSITDDLYITLLILNKGYKFLYEVNSLATEETAKNLTTEFKRKVRFASTNFQTIKFFKKLLFGKNILIAFALWSHKILRWITPIFLMLIFIANIFLIQYNFVYQITLYIQIILYLIALVGYISSIFKIKIPFVSMVFYFVYSNIAIFVGFIKFLSGSHSNIWNPTER